MSLTLPILDLSQLDASADAAARFRADLREATHDVGFFYLVGHGVDQALIDELLAVSRQFFELSAEQKLAIENVHSPQFRGYTRIGGELTQGDVDWREQIDIGVERAVVEPGPNIPDYWRLEGPNLWPDALPQLAELAGRWNDELSKVALRLLRAWALSLGVAENVFDEAFATKPF